jgi:ABC-type polysaccharide/polyol phosphate transport system ATPase subunit
MLGMLNLQHSLQRAAFGLDDDGAVQRRSASRAKVLAGPVVIDVGGLHKTFRVPLRSRDTLKERVVHPLRRVEFRELRALRGISFDVHRGEFFGIVGRNGSGKSTLLKVLASIYRADAGRIRMAGRLAPFIELGVGFNPELTARENVELNGVMMGLGRRGARRRLDSVLEFAELREFVDLKLKNYSSGMMVRLAFAVMVEADADVMLVDEVLAVGDAAFAQKCTDVFREKRDAGKTLILVTHDMATVQAFCDRAMLIHDGEQKFLGEPEEAALGYYRLNFGAASVASNPERAIDVPDINVRVKDVWLEDESGRRVQNVEQRKRFRLNFVAQARQELVDPVFNFHCLNMAGHWVFTLTTEVEADVEGRRRVAEGERIRVVAEIDNPLLPGRYTTQCWISRSGQEGNMAVQILRLVDFHVYGTRPGPGNVVLDADVEAVLDHGLRA